MKTFVKPSKRGTDFQKALIALEAAAREVSFDVSTGMDGVFLPWVQEGETPPSQEEYRQKLLGRWLQHVRQRVIATDEAHQASIRVERMLRFERDQGSSEILIRLRGIRNTFEKVYGEGKAAVHLGLSADFPEDPVVLHRSGQRLVQMMSDPELELPEPEVKSGSIDPAELVQDLKPPVERMGAAFEQLAVQKRRTQLALKEKTEAFDLARYAGGRVARYLEALSYLSGEDFHADRVRLSSHVKVLEAAPEEEEDPDTESGEQVEAAGETEPEGEVESIEEETEQE
ncbi:MAG: hypothetical protein GY719_21105 [bacterium]|nr:hypothetical protein [bacterium]